MHNRRFDAYLVGMWLMGAILLSHFVSQSQLNVERLFADPPVGVQRQLAGVGTEAAQALLRYQANEMSRRVQEVWEVLQLGILTALLAASVLTEHRSRTAIIAAVVMIALVGVQSFAITPKLLADWRALDFVSSDEAARRSQETSVEVRQILYRIIDFVKLAIALGLSARLLLDFSGWKRRNRRAESVRRAANP